VNGELKVPFGKREDGTIVHISELTLEENGLKCRCVCPSPDCGMRLQARNAGNIRVHYFAHDSQTDCKGGVESALHLFAKEVFQRNNTVKLPEFQVHVDWDSLKPVRPRRREKSEATDPYFFRDYDSMPVADAEYTSYSQAVLEEGITDNLGRLVPDIMLVRQAAPSLLVEILVTHAVDTTKEERLRALGLPCIEIDLSDMYEGLDAFDREGVEQLLIHGDGQKGWVYFPDEGSYYEQLREKIRLEDEQERLRHEQEIREEEERARKREELQERLNRTAEDRLRRQDKLMSPEQVAKSEERKQVELAAHPMWKRNSRILGISADNIPYYLNVPLEGEYLFKCHRSIWQSTLFISWVVNKSDPTRSRDVHIDYAVKNLKEKNPELLELALYWAFKDRPREVMSAADVVGHYFAALDRYGFVKHYGYSPYVGNPYSWVFRCVRPEVVILPPEFNSPRFLVKDDGLLDTETGEIVTL